MHKPVVKIFLAASALLVTGAAMAALPAPSDEAKAAAAQASAKAAWAGKVGAYQLCKAQDRTAAFYFRTAKAGGHETRAAAATPACADPGDFSYAPAEPAKPLEAAGAHSPPATVTSPPSGKVPAADIAPAKKP